MSMPWACIPTLNEAEVIDLNCAAIVSLTSQAWYLEDLAFAQRVHGTQFDKAGKPYWTHLERVSQRLVRRFPDATPDQVRAALLHDSVEDREFTGLEYQDLLDHGYSPVAVETVRLVTKDKTDGLTYLQRMEILASTDDLPDIRQRLADYGLAGLDLDQAVVEVKLGALMVKLSDNEDNSEPVRIASLPLEKQSILTSRYQPARVILEAGLLRLTEFFSNRETAPAFAF
jgi:hypothetical protein